MRESLSASIKDSEEYCDLLQQCGRKCAVYYFRREWDGITAPIAGDDHTIRGRGPPPGTRVVLVSREEFNAVEADRFRNMEALYKRCSTYAVTRISCTCIAFKKQARRPAFCKHTIAVGRWEDMFTGVESTPTRAPLASMEVNTTEVPIPVLVPRPAGAISGHVSDTTLKRERSVKRDRSVSRMADITPVKNPNGVWHSGAVPRPMNKIQQDRDGKDQGNVVENK